MSDALDRIEPVARPLLSRVDAALVAHGAPAGHPIWDSLRRLATTPGDAVAFFAALNPAPLRSAAVDVREQISRYAGAPIPARVPWSGAGGESYAPVAAALEAHLGAPGSGAGTAPGDTESMAGRLLATASYVDDVAEWIGTARTSIAVALADVLASSQALAVRRTDALAGDIAQIAGRVPAGVVAAAADIGAHLLIAAEEAHSSGHDLIGRWSGLLGELSYHGAAPQPVRHGSTIDFHH
jgi:hypothetical protein